MADLNGLIKELEDRMLQDCRRLSVWRVVHRTTGLGYTIVLIFVPAVLAVGFTSSETVVGKVLLLTAAVVGGLNVTFKPYVHSQHRRAAVNTMRRLRDDFRADVLHAGERDLLDVYRKYAAAYAMLFEQRGAELVDGRLAHDEPDPPAKPPPLDPGTPS